jgi:hypothetical protein
VDVFRDWTIKIMVRNAEDNTIRGSYRPMRSANIRIVVVRLFVSVSAKQSCGSGFIESRSGSSIPIRIQGLMTIN